MAQYYPIYLQIADTLSVVVGGGSVAERKVRSLREAGGRVRVVSPALTSQLQALSEASEIEYLCQLYEASTLEGGNLIFAATDNREVNDRVLADAKAAGKWVNMADAPEEGNFITPSVVRRGELCISMVTGGNSPSLTARISTELEARFGPEYGEYVRLLGQMRSFLKATNPQAGELRAAQLRLLDSEALLCNLLREDKHEEALALAEQLVRNDSDVSSE